jgi:hypothetical protein
MISLNSKHRQTLAAVFYTPLRSNIKWSDVESLLQALGAVMEEGNGSRVRFLLNNVVAVFHRPHPQKEIDKGAIKSLRKFLINSGVYYG